MNRAQRRAQAKQEKKFSKSSNNLEDTVGMFELLPDECSSCTSPYDKKNCKIILSNVLEHR